MTVFQLINSERIKQIPPSFPNINYLSYPLLQPDNCVSGLDNRWTIAEHKNQ